MANITYFKEKATGPSYFIRIILLNCFASSLRTSVMEFGCFRFVNNILEPVRSELC